MATEKPLTGWGPGTYQFQYAPYQMASEKTAISTNWGEGGNIHSEYLGALVESGIPGFILYLLLMILVLYRGAFLFRNEEERDTRYLILALCAGVVTYAVHGALNNFLDTDKISALFWGMAAAITALDIRENSGAEEIVGAVQQQ
jgi:O-antigen ligase